MNTQTWKSLVVQGELLHLLPERVVYWPGGNALFLSDLHLGKTEHFRKNGIAIPAAVARVELDAFSKVLENLPDAIEVYLIGDLFHSQQNAAWDDLAALMARFPRNFHLIMGNHDLQHSGWYSQQGMAVHASELYVGPFMLRHHPFEAEEIPAAEAYVISGHVHPGVRLVGSGRQNLTIPCFYFGEKQAILPAFGRFTGKYIIYPGSNDRVAGIADNQLITWGF